MPSALRASDFDAAQLVSESDEPHRRADEGDRERGDDGRTQPAPLPRSRRLRRRIVGRHTHAVLMVLSPTQF
jgi:hypothetical protein